MEAHVRNGVKVVAAFVGGNTFIADHSVGLCFFLPLPCVCNAHVTLFVTLLFLCLVIVHGLFSALLNTPVINVGTLSLQICTIYSIAKYTINLWKDSLLISNEGRTAAIVYNCAYYHNSLFYKTWYDIIKYL